MVNKTNEKNSLSRQKFVENVGRRRKFVVEIYEKYVDQKKHQMVTHILGKACKSFFFDETLKKLSDVDRQKKDCFLAEVEQKVCNQQTL